MLNYKATLLTVVYVLVVLSAVCSALFVILSFFMYLDERKNAMLILCLSSFFLFLLAFLSRRISAYRAKLLNNEIDNFILKFAMKNSGLITAVELASETEYSLTEASQHLERNFKAGFCDKRLTNKDLIDVYVYKGAISKEEKDDSFSASELT